MVSFNVWALQWEVHPHDLLYDFGVIKLYPNQSGMHVGDVLQLISDNNIKLPSTDSYTACISGSSSQPVEMCSIHYGGSARS